MEADFLKAGLTINVMKSIRVPTQRLRQLGFDVDLPAGLFRIPDDRWHQLGTTVNSIMTERGGRVQARQLAIVVGQVISMRLAWGLVTQFYTRNLYALLNIVCSLGPGSG